jgi:putative membrane protein
MRMSFQKEHTNMRGFLIRCLIAAVGLWLAAALIPGITFTRTSTVIWASLLLGIVNALIRPLVVIVTLPITLVTLGLFLLVVNGVMLTLVAAVLPGLVIQNFLSAILGAIVLAITAWLASSFVGSQGRYERLGRRTW